MPRVYPVTPTRPPSVHEFGFDSRCDGRPGPDNNQPYTLGIQSGLLAYVRIPLGYTRDCLAKKLVVTAFRAAEGFIDTPLTRVPVRLREVIVHGVSVTSQGPSGGVLVGVPPTLDDLAEAEGAFNYRKEAPLTMDDRLVIFHALEAKKVNWPIFSVLNGKSNGCVIVFENIASFPIHIFGQVEGQIPSDHDGLY